MTDEEFGDGFKISYAKLVAEARRARAREKVLEGALRNVLEIASTLSGADADDLAFLNAARAALAKPKGGGT